MGCEGLFFKLENLNPSGSYKDRFASVVISEMVSRSQKLCLCTSSGNTGSALAAYAAAAGIKCVVATVDGAPMAKLKQMQLYGAEVLMIAGFGKDPRVTTEVFDRLAQFLQSSSLPFPVSAYRYHPQGMRGVETMAWEIMEELSARHIFVPAGGGGLTLAIAKGVKAFKEYNGLEQTPSVHCVQPTGNDTIAGALRAGEINAHAVGASTTLVSGLQVASVIDGAEVIAACRDLGGNGHIVEDAEVFALQKRLAFEEGIFCEPASAVALAGALRALANGEINVSENIVCLVTGSGFKDISSAEKLFGLPEVPMLENASALEKLLKTNSYG